MPTRKNFPSWKEMRVKSAKERQAASDALTHEQKVARLLSKQKLGMKCSKEEKKLIKEEVVS